MERTDGRGREGWGWIENWGATSEREHSNEQAQDKNKLQQVQETRPAGE